ncbi:MAG: hypothetical protein RH917_12710 [Lacipirellulaceae bacterium]
MKIAVLGNDPESQSLAEAALRLGHEVSFLSSPENFNDPAATSHLPELFYPASFDGVIVGPAADSSSSRELQIQELMKLGLPILAVHPVVGEVLAYFEIDMARGESGGLLQHYNPLTEHQILLRLAEWIREGHPQIGRVEQVVAERTFEDRSRPAVLNHFARDVEALIRIAGPLNRIGALGSGNEDAAYAGLSVQLLGKQAVPVRWSVGPVSTEPGLEITLVGEQGRVSLRFDSDHQVVEGTHPSPLAMASVPEPIAPGEQAIERFLRAIDLTEAASTWSDALQAMELVDSIEISLRRGRMIEVHHQQLTEHLAFKGTMAAVGCGVIMVFPPLLLLLGWIAGLFGIPLPRHWYAYLLLAMLALFLGLQVLPKLVYSDKPKPEEPS